MDRLAEIEKRMSEIKTELETADETKWLNLKPKQQHSSKKEKLSEQQLKKKGTPRSTCRR